MHWGTENFGQPVRKKVMNHDRHIEEIFQREATCFSTLPFCHKYAKRNALSVHVMQSMSFAGTQTQLALIYIY